MSNEHPKALAAEQNRAIRNAERAKIAHAKVEHDCELVDIDIPSERQLCQRRVEQLIRYDRARMAARLNGARMAEYFPREMTPEPKGGILIELVMAWVRLWSGR